MPVEKVRELAVGNLAVTGTLTVQGRPVDGNPPAQRLAGGKSIVFGSARIATGLDRIVAAVACRNVGPTAAIAVAWSGSNLDVHLDDVPDSTAVLVNWIALGT